MKSQLYFLFWMAHAEPLAKKLIGDASSNPISKAACVTETSHELRHLRAKTVDASLPSGMSEALAGFDRGGSVTLGHLGNVTVGTSEKQTFEILFDTGSSTFLVPGPRCPDSQCSTSTRYNEGGFDENATISLTYGRGRTRSGGLYLDSVSVAGVTVDDMELVSTSHRDGPNAPPFGIMGMGFGRLRGGEATFFELAMEQNKVSANEFSFYLGRDAADTKTSQLTIGGRDTSKYTGRPATLPVVNYRHWTVRLDGVSVNGNLISGAASDAIMDTGTTVINGPAAAVDALYQAIPGATQFRRGSYMYPCVSAPKVALRMSGTDFVINDLDFAVGRDGDMCIGAIHGRQRKDWLVGDAFLKSWYSIYSYDANSGKPAVLLARVV